MKAINKATELVNQKEYALAIARVIDEFKEKSFVRKWKATISDLIDHEEVRINSVAIGTVADLPARIYVGANTNHILIFDFDGTHLDTIELDEGDEVWKLIIIDVTKDRHVGNELLVQTTNDSILFYGVNTKSDYQKLQYRINYSTSTITSVFAIALNDEEQPIFIGDSNGGVLKTSYDNLKLDKDKQSVIPESEKLNGEIVAAITGSPRLLNGAFGLVVGYKNGVLLLLDDEYACVSKFDIDREIENIYLIDKNQNLVVTTDDYHVFHFSIIDGKFVNNWNYDTEGAISMVLADPRVDSAVEFLILCEDKGTISCFGKVGNLILTGDPSFEGTAGDFYGQKLILASREGELAQFEVMEQEKINGLSEALFESYAGICRSKSDNDFCEFFNAEFESDERMGYFKEFLADYLAHDPDPEFVDKINSLFQRKKYNTDIADGLISKIISNSILKTRFLSTFKESVAASEINNFQMLIDANKNATNLIKKAETYVKIDPVKYIELMSEIRIQRLDKKWVNNISEDDDVVAIKYYHNPYSPNELDLLIGTRKGSVLLLDKKSGQIIWSFKLDIGDGQITSIAVADVCNNGSLEIVIGLENAQNSILVLCVEKNKFNSANKEMLLKWHAGYAPSESFKLFLIRCRVSGMDFNAVHKVHCFDFDFNGVQDLIISSEHGRFEIFYFDETRRDRIIPKTKAIDINDDDILVFDMTRNENGKIMLHTGSASGNIEQHIYDGVKFESTSKSFTERDARITDIVLADLDNEKVVLFSSEDNFVYCLDSDLEYMWSFKTRGDVKSIGVSDFDGQKLILAISDDSYLYALDRNGNKKWDYPFFSPLDKLFVSKSDIVVADSDGNIYLLHIENSDSITKKMDEELAGAAIDLMALLENPAKYVRVYAVHKLLGTDPSPDVLAKILLTLSDGNEFEEVVRSEVVRLMTAYALEHGLNAQTSEALLSTLKDSSKEVRLEGVKSFFKLIERHQAFQMDLGSILVEVTKDEDIWVKEYLAGALNRIANDGGLAEAKWKALLSLMTLNKDEEWILNEAANSIGNFLSNATEPDFLLNVLSELFNNGLEEETLERIKKVIPAGSVLRFFNVHYQILFGDLGSIKEAVKQFEKGESVGLKTKSVETFIGKTHSCTTLADQINIDEVIGDQLLKKVAEYWKGSTFSLAEGIKNLEDYQRENNISDKIVYLKYAADSISTLAKSKVDLPKIDKRLFELVVEGYLGDLISKTSRMLLENVYLDIELENREVTVNEDGVADINFNIVNNGYRPVEEIEINVKQSRQFEILENIGEVGELVRAQKKKVFFKIKAKTLGPVEVFLDITYKGSVRASQELIKVHLNENIQKEWIVIKNPYTSGIPIENDDVFVGRESLIEEAITALEKDPVFVMGHRRMGKTSLIKYIQRHHLSTDNFVTVFVSAEKLVFDSMNAFLFSFSRPIADDLVRKKIITAAQKKEYTDAIRANGLIDFGVFFDDILLEVGQANKTLVLIIDEYPLIHEAVELGKVDSSFITNLRGYMQNNSREFKMIYSGASSLKYLKSQYSSNIMGVGKSLEVSFLDEDDVKKLIQKPLNGQMLFDDSAFQYFMEITNGQPFLVQVCLSYLVDKLNKEKKSSMVFKEALEEGLSYFLEQAPHLQDDWNNRVYSNNLKWEESDEKIAKVYKKLIVTAVTDNWKKTRNGLKKEDIYTQLENALADFHKINRSIFDETLNILAGNDDILKRNNNLYFIKVGLFREWVIGEMNLAFGSTLVEARNTLSASGRNV